ncbi:hypothetical protein, partial [Pseudomonas syringae]
GCRFLKAPMAQQSKNSGLLQTIHRFIRFRCMKIDCFQQNRLFSADRQYGVIALVNLVSTDLIYWSVAMQMGGQVHANSH